MIFARRLDLAARNTKPGFKMDLDPPAINVLGKTMGIKTIAERVESAEVLACLADIGVEYAQGIYVAIPESVESLSRITRTTPQLKLVHSA